MRKIAIVGLAKTTMYDAPFDDPSWEIWTLPWAAMRRGTVYFEPHEDWWTLDYYSCGEGRERIAEWLRDLHVPVFMNQLEPDVPNSVAIPWDDICALVGKSVNGPQGVPYIESTIGLMLAYAALTLEPGDRVGIWGVDMNTGEEYAYQRPNAEYLVGFLRGRGIRVFIPEISALTSTLFPESGRYGNRDSNIIPGADE